jgi:pimeloyl-ACP methyl ester carboxylesterase
MTMQAHNQLAQTREPMRWLIGASGIRLAVDFWGGATGPLVVLLHGGGQTRYAWKHVGQMLGTAGYCAVAFDARGHGDSDWAPNGQYSQDAMVADLEHVIEAFGNRRPALIGASMGGGTSLLAVGEGRLDATALVLVDIAPRIEKEGVDKIKAFMRQKPGGFASLEEVADAIAAYQPQRPRPESLDGLSKNVRLGSDGKYRWHWDPRFLDGKRDMRQRERRLAASARNIRIPTLLVRGALSDLLSEEGARAFLELAPHSEYVTVAGAAHMVAGDRNDIFGSAVIDFLARAARRGAGAAMEGEHNQSQRRRMTDITDIP